MSEAEGRRQLMRLLHGELPLEEARALRLRLTEDPALQREYRDLKATWERLSLPEPRRTPPGFARQVVSRALVPAAGEEHGRSTALGWRRLAAGFALPIGVALGMAVVRALPGPPVAAIGAPMDEVSARLDASYWLALDELLDADEQELAR